MTSGGRSEISIPLFNLSAGKGGSFSFSWDSYFDEEGSGNGHSGSYYCDFD